MTAISELPPLATIEHDTHQGLTCRDFDTLVADGAAEAMALRTRIARLTELLDQTRTRLRECENDNRILAEQNDLLSEDLMLSTPAGTITSVAISTDAVRDMWRDLHPGSRGPVPAAARDTLMDSGEELSAAVHAAARHILATLD